MKHFIGKHTVFFFGVVEDINDPVELGRVRVRCYGYHTEDKSQIPTDSLPWAIVLSPTDSASVSGVGQTPSGLMQGSWVFGIFIDGERAQEPMVLGSVAGAPYNEVDGTIGFNDPDENFPRYTQESDVNKLSRGTQTKSYTPDDAIGEPDDPYNAQYPYNRVMESRSGHVKEYDDTPDSERIRELHKSGTFYQVHPDGTVSTHIVKDGYRVVAGNDSIHVTGDVKVVINGNSDVSIDGNATLNIGGNFSADVGGTYDVTSEGNMSFSAPRIDWN